MSAFAVKRWDDVPIRIEKLHQQAREHAYAAVEAAAMAGELLIAQKKEIGHGQWLEWLEANVTFSERTARNYMRLARELPKLEAEDRQRVADLSFRDAMRALATDTNRITKLPEPAIEEALILAESEPLHTSVSRAVNAESIHRYQEEFLARSAERKEIKWTTWAPTPVPLPEWRIELKSKILVVVNEVMATHPDLVADEICEAINDAYCEVQDGTLP